MFNIGTFLFSAVFIYLVVAFILFMTKSHVSPYEITDGSIVEDSVYNGVIIRDETRVQAAADGYLAYYLDDVSKAGAGQHVCALSKDSLKDLIDTSKEEGKKLSGAQEEVMLTGIQHYVTSYSPESYAKLYDLHNEIDTAYGVNSTDYMSDQVDELAASGAAIAYVDAPADGLIVYTVDSLDGLKAEDVSEDLFEKKDYTEQINRQNAQVKKDDGLFKIIQSETWQIMFPLSGDAAERMKDLTMIETRIGSMQGTIWGNFEVVDQNGNQFGKLTYSADMLQFASQRFVSVELILQNDSGLKIPASAVVERSVYEIPSEFIIRDPNTAETGVMTKEESGSTVFTPVDLFAEVQIPAEDPEGESTSRTYVKRSELTKDTVLYRDNEPGTYTVGKTVKMKGVYNINKGYASFQYIHVIASNDMYYIVENNTAYGPSTYDHIALNADELKENIVVY